MMEDVPEPQPSPGQVRIAVRAFGLNRSEYFTRLGHSPSVKLPRVLGIECVGEVIAAPGGEFAPGQRVCAMMGGMGRDFDGSYAEETCVPARSVFPIRTDLDWATFAALPEMLQTCLGSLSVGLGAERGQALLIRGGTSSIGLTTLALAKDAGLTVTATTRSEDKRQLLLDAGADAALVDDGKLSAWVRRERPEGFDAVLELLGTRTLLDSLQCVRRGGVVCMTGILGGEWELAAFRPMEHIPTGVRLTCYSGGAGDITAERLQRAVTMVERGELKLRLGPVWRFDQLVEAHRVMDEDRANGKMVVVL